MYNICNAILVFTCCTRCHFPETPPPKKMYNPESCDELTGVGDGEAVGRLDVVHVRHQVERGFRGIRAGVVQEDCQTKGGVLLISVSDEQTA